FHMGIAEAALLGAFTAQDLGLFVLFFDLMLIPFFFLMLGWGGPERRSATIKMVIYTLVGSLLMLAAAVATAVLSAQEADRPLPIVLPLFPDATVDFQLAIMILAVVGIVYGSAMAFTQTNLRLILGYSSLAQLSFITLGIFSLRDEGIQGAILQSITHGLV